MNHVKIIFIITSFIFTNLYSQRQFVFLGSFNWEKDTESIYVYELNSKTGKLTKVTSSSDVINPGYITISNDGKYIYAASDAKIPNSGTVSSFVFDVEKKLLTFLNQQKTSGENPVYVNVDKDRKWLTSVTYNKSSISMYPLNKNGTIDSITQHFEFSKGSEVNPTRQEKSHLHSVIFSSDNKSILIADLGADKIINYPFESNLKEPLINTKSNFISTKAGSGPRHLIFGKDKKTVYCVEELSGMISVYDFSSNHLKNIQIISTHSNKIKTGLESSDVHISPDGKFLYATNRGKENNIAIFRVKENGTLEAIGYKKTAGKHPRTFAIDETGKFIIVTNTKSQNITVFKRNIENGSLKKMGKSIKIKNPTCVKIKMY